MTMDGELVEARRRFCQTALREAPTGGKLAFEWGGTAGQGALDLPTFIRLQEDGANSPADFSTACLQAMEGFASRLARHFPDTRCLVMGAGGVMHVTMDLKTGHAKVSAVRHFRDTREVESSELAVPSPIALEKALRGGGSLHVADPGSAERIAGFCEAVAARFAGSPELREAMGGVPALRLGAEFRGHSGQGAVGPMTVKNFLQVHHAPLAPKGEVITGRFGRYGRIVDAVDALADEAGGGLERALRDLATACGHDIVNKHGGDSSIVMSVPMPEAEECVFQLARTTFRHYWRTGNWHEAGELPPDEAMSRPRRPASVPRPEAPAP